MHCIKVNENCCNLRGNIVYYLYKWRNSILEVRPEMKDAFCFAYAMQYVFQVTFSMLTPAAFFIGGGWLLHTRCGLGKWVLIVAIVLGLVSGLYSMFAFLLSSVKSVDPTKKEDEPRG